MINSICVYSASSDGVNGAYRQAAQSLGRLIAEHGCTLVYGGGKAGLMGALAESVHRHGGTVCGIIPQFMVHREWGYEACDELILTQDLRERKGLMEARADAFVALPGGLGTLEELLEVITLKQLQSHDKPIVILNTQGFYDPLLGLLEHLYAHQFAKPAHRDLFHVAADPDEAFDYLLGKGRLTQRRPCG